MLPTSFISRLYSHPDDLEGCTNLLRRVRSPQRIVDYPSVVDLYELLNLPAVQAHTRLWLDGEQVVAFAFVDEYNNLYFETDPSRGEALGDTALNWAISEARQLAAEQHNGEPPETSCRSDNATLIAMLERHGFTRVPERGLHFVRPLGQAAPEPQLPPGFTIRPTYGKDEVEDWVKLHRAAFGTEYMTVEYRLSMIGVPDHDPELDLVCVAPDGRLAAYCVGFISADENALTGCQAGYTDPVATHPDFQRRGLSKALLCTALNLLKARGMQMARLGTSSENLAMQRAAQAVGFTIESETWRYQLN